MVTDTELTPTLVLLRGWLRDSRHWEDFPTHLQAECRIRGISPQILTPDLPGNGARWQEQSPASIKEIFARTRPNIEVKRPLYLLGLSMGGMVATEWLHQRPQEVKGMILVNSSMRPFSRPWERLKPKAWLRILGQMLSQPQPREELIMELTLSKPFQNSDRLSTWLQWYREMPVSQQSAYRQLVAAACYKAPFSYPPPLPVLVISSMDDQLVSPVCSQKIAEAWQADFRSVPGGHDLPVEQPRLLAQEVSQWLADRHEVIN